MKSSQNAKNDEKTRDLGWCFLAHEPRQKFLYYGTVKTKKSGGTGAPDIRHFLMNVRMMHNDNHQNLKFRGKRVQNYENA